MLSTDAVLYISNLRSVLKYRLVYFGLLLFPPSAQLTVLPSGTVLLYKEHRAYPGPRVFTFAIPTEAPVVGS
ncbi:hypothetical protein F4813DRAFT_348353 [Daldinia decipiens]|uniref:uncharacterized protein n=1 Tax=Daldinia decipiens TaxID=326647 RepID=UPI0020C24AEA|nr:uncharacterized protein F4813DRAFT_348353 [Daldinia decipiens]KAI1660809.1 hypothetical protein F4813DRAFT_348353 [Daldinia decipiens]